MKNLTNNIIKLKRGTSVSIINMKNETQSPNWTLPFEINGAFDFEISECSCCDEKIVSIFNVLDDEDLIIHADLKDIEIKTLPMTMEQSIDYLNSKVDYMNEQLRLAGRQ